MKALLKEVIVNIGSLESQNPRGKKVITLLLLLLLLLLKEKYCAGATSFPFPFTNLRQQT